MRPAEIAYPILRGEASRPTRMIGDLDASGPRGGSDIV
jgi:hypothetical protein